MSIIKVINGEKKVIANVSITDHNQLTGRDAYGAHPISAIRKLPEKLHELKEKDIELEGKIAAHDAEVDAQVTDVISRIDTKIDEVNTLIDNNQDIIESAVSNLSQELHNKTDNIIVSSQQIGLIESPNEEGKLLFTDYDGNQTLVQGGFLTDNDTIILNNEKKITLNKVYTNNTITGSGTTSDPLIVKGISDDAGTNSINFNDITNLSTSLTNAHNRIDEVNKLDELQNHKIKSVEDITKGMGGYLNSYDFETSTPTQESLTAYAIQDTGAANQSELFTGTKVINLYDDHIWILTNTPDSTPAVFSWQDLGVQPTISVATDKYFGLVKSSYEPLEGSVDLNGYISINGLETRLNEIDTNYNTLSSNTQTRLDNLSSRIDSNDASLVNHAQSINNLVFQGQEFSNSIDDLNTRIDNLDGDYATDAELSAVTAQLALATKIIRLNEV